jgi:hypothetical protein
MNKPVPVPEVQSQGQGQTTAASLLMSGAWLRGLIALGLVAVLWGLVGWALGSAP